MQSDSYRLKDIDRAICAVYPVQPRQLAGRSVAQNIVRPRFAAIHLARQLTNRSLPQIGDHYHRDHTTILYAQRKAAALMESDCDFAEIVLAARGVLAGMETERQILRRVAFPLTQSAGPLVASDIAASWV